MRAHKGHERMLHLQACAHLLHHVVDNGPQPLRVCRLEGLQQLCGSLHLQAAMQQAAMRARQRGLPRHSAAPGKRVTPSRTHALASMPHQIASTGIH